MGEIILHTDLLLAVIFVVLASLHFAWALGSTFFLDHSIPTNEEGKRLFNPTWSQSAIVGIGLLFFGSIYYIKSQSEILPREVLQWILWIIPTIFFIRFIGEFRYVGLFKKIRQTKFGKTDSFFILPLCALIVILGMLSALDY